ARRVLAVPPQKLHTKDPAEPGPELDKKQEREALSLDRYHESVKSAGLFVNASDSIRRNIDTRIILMDTRSESAELQRRAAQLVQLRLETVDKRLRDLLLCLSQEFRQAAKQTGAVDGPSGPLSDLVPRNDET